MSRTAALLCLIFFSSVGSADTLYRCDYTMDKGRHPTRVEFKIPGEPKFGLLIPIKISVGTTSEAAMNMVILKDRPYLLLADVFRITDEQSTMFFLKVSPTKRHLQVGVIKMESDPTLTHAQGLCTTMEQTL